VDVLLKDPYVQQTVRLFGKLTIALVGIGSIEPSSLVASSGNVTLLSASFTRPILHQLIDLYRNQADIIREVFFACKFLNLSEKLNTELVGAKAG
jgi:hypothetical protein